MNAHGAGFLHFTYQTLTLPSFHLFPQIKLEERQYLLSMTTFTMYWEKHPIVGVDGAPQNFAASKGTRFE
jgi:hypothetical protein